MNKKNQIYERQWQNSYVGCVLGERQILVLRVQVRLWTQQREDSKQVW